MVGVSCTVFPFSRFRHSPDAFRTRMGMTLGGQGFVALQTVGQRSTILDANGGGITTLRGEHDGVVLTPEVGR